MIKVLINEYSDLPDKKVLQAYSKEEVSRGSSFFPLKYYLNNTVDPHYDLPVHYHSEFELIHVISGSYNMFFRNQEYELKKDDIFIITGEDLHGDGSVKSSALYESIVFDVDMIRLHSYEPDIFINQILNKNIIVNGYIQAKNTQIIDTVKKLFDVIKNSPSGWESVACGFLLIFFGLVKMNHLYTEVKVMPPQRQRQFEQIESVIQMIRTDYKNELPLDDMARNANLSSKYFCRIFKEVTKKSPIEYLNWYRINRACSQLRETKLKIPDIAEACGFNDFSYFIKIFKKFKGTTPLKYRNAADKENS